MTSAPVKLCKDCRYIQMDYDPDGIRACLHPIYEKSKWHFRLPVEVARRVCEEKKYECGPTAKFWEPIECENR